MERFFGLFSSSSSQRSQRSDSNPHTSFTLENLKQQCELLRCHAEVSPFPDATVVETLRVLAELMVWGDQHNEHFFFYFCEKTVLKTFLQILSNSPSREVVKQLLQTLSMMVLNLSNQTSVYYLMSNNYINEIIVHQVFDFTDEEIMSNYISLLKTLSLLLNFNTLEFFFDARTLDFPLYTESIRFVTNPDNMVRIAVRTITLNVYRVGMDSEELSKYLLHHHVVPYFTSHMMYLKEQAMKIESIITKEQISDVLLDQLKRCIEEHLDSLYYFLDILDLEIVRLSGALCDQLLSQYVFPVLVGSFVKSLKNSQISSNVGFFLLAQIFFVFRNATILNSILSVILRENPVYLGKLLVENPPPYPVITIDIENSVSDQKLLQDKFIADLLYTKADNYDVVNFGRVKSKSKEYLRPSEVVKPILKTDLNLMRVRSKLPQIQQVCRIQELYQGLDYCKKLQKSSFRSDLFSFFESSNLDENLVTVCCQMLRIVIRNKVVDLNELIEGKICPQGDMKAQKLINSLVMTHVEDSKSEEGGLVYDDVVIEQLLGCLSFCLSNSSWNPDSIHLILKLMADLTRDLPLSIAGNPILKSSHLVRLESFLQNLLDELRSNVEGFLKLMDDPNLTEATTLLQAIQTLQIFDEQIMISNSKDLLKEDDFSHFVSDYRSVLPFKHISCRNSVGEAEFLKNRISLYILFKKYLTYFKSTSEKPALNFGLLNIPHQPDYKYSLGVAPQSIRSAEVKEYECDVLATEHGGIRNLFVVVLPEYMLLLERKPDKTATIEMVSHILRTDAAISERDSCMVRFAIRAEQKPYSACKLTSPGQKLKIWNFAVRFHSPKAAITVLQRLFETTCLAVKLAFPFVKISE